MKSIIFCYQNKIYISKTRTKPKNIDKIKKQKYNNSARIKQNSAKLQGVKL